MCAENNGLAGVVMHKGNRGSLYATCCLSDYLRTECTCGYAAWSCCLSWKHAWEQNIWISSGHWLDCFSNMIDVVRLPKLRVLSPLHWTTTYAYLRSDDAVPLWYILAVEIAIILVTGFIIMKKSKTYTLDAIESGL